jgi:hypothetical protein
VLFSAAAMREREEEAGVEELWVMDVLSGFV